MRPDQIFPRLRRDWRRNKVRLVVLSALITVGLALSLAASLTNDPQDWRGLLLNLGTEMVGAVVTYVLLQGIIGTSSRKAELIAQMGSDVRDVALPAADELRRYGWLTNGSLREAKLQRANLWDADLNKADLQDADLEGAKLQEANLWKANLRRANLEGTYLQGAFLFEADLQEAILTRTDLRSANLSGANLQGVTIVADLEGASLVRADLRGADLRLAHGLDQMMEESLYGAKANSMTKWPKGFEVPDTVQIVED